MKIEYEATLEEMTDASWLKYRGSITYKQTRLKVLMIAPFLALIFYLLITDDPVRQTFMAVGSLLIYPIIILLIYDPLTKRSMRKQLLNHLGGSGPYPSEYEIDEKGLYFRHAGTEMKFEWNTIKGVKQSEQYLELDMEGLAFAIIPFRIFESTAEQDRWHNYIKERISAR
jgi:hypothetical protein